MNEKDDERTKYRQIIKKIFFLLVVFTSKTFFLSFGIWYQKSFTDEDFLKIFSFFELSFHLLFYLYEYR